MTRRYIVSCECESSPSLLCSMLTAGGMNYMNAFRFFVTEGGVAFLFGGGRGILVIREDRAQCVWSNVL